MRYKDNPLAVRFLQNRCELYLAGNADPDLMHDLVDWFLANTPRRLTATQIAHLADFVAGSCTLQDAYETVATSEGRTVAGVKKAHQLAFGKSKERLEQKRSEWRLASGLMGHAVHKVSIRFEP
jgi:hypothetical protein